MNKEELSDNNKFEKLIAAEIWKMIYNKELNSKKSILEYIHMTRMLKKENASEEQIKDTYNYIYEHINFEDLTYNSISVQQKRFALTA